MLRIWGRSNSINVMKVLWVCGEIGLEYERIDAGLHFGVVNTAEYAAMNPNRKVPTIDDHGTILFESNVICRYLAVKRQREDLMPSEVSRRFSVERWMDWASISVSQGMTPLFWQLVRTPEKERNGEVIANALAEAERCMRIINDQVVREGFMAGSSFTLADVPAAAFVHRWLALPISRPTLPVLEQYHTRMLGRPAYREHVALALI
jgi:glutathione S-transferase